MINPKINVILFKTDKNICLDYVSKTNLSKKLLIEEEKIFDQIFLRNRFLLKDLETF